MSSVTDAKRGKRVQPSPGCRQISLESAGEWAARTVSSIDWSGASSMLRAKTRRYATGG
ncbi:hypothetical protein ARTHRO9AX_130067 [Arthrobacter sp. 9AX]|nr:hypothetical protein ARTHRO9AX_130067 [Arthrobacter sp. 9AX]